MFYVRDFKDFSAFSNISQLATFDLQMICFQVIHHLESQSNYRIQIAAHDGHHCEGELAEIYINSNLT